MRTTSFLLLAIVFSSLSFVGCGPKFDQDDFDRLKVGMTLTEVEEILGKADDSEGGGVKVLGLEGSVTQRFWRSGDREIVVAFVNEKVSLLSKKGF